MKKKDLILKSVTIIDPVMGRLEITQCDDKILITILNLV